MQAVYYNEIDQKSASWLRELIKQGHIADGVVDDRSIIDVKPNELLGFTQCHFFAGIGVWSYALRSAGWSDDRSVWTGSCPCQPFSSSGSRGGFDDERHLWPHWHHLISQCQPAIVFGEQVASKNGLDWLDLVSTDMEATGYAFGAADLCAAGVGAPHIRQRLFFGAVRMANTSSAGSQGRLPGRKNEEWEDQHGHLGRDCTVGRPNPTNGYWGDADWLYCRGEKWRAVEPSTFPLVNGASERVGRLRGYGNAIVAQVAQTFIESMMEITT